MPDKRKAALERAARSVRRAAYCPPPMHPMRQLRRIRAYIDGFDVLFGLFPGLTGYAAFVSWARVIVRALRGEAVIEDRRTTYATAAFIAARAISSGTHVRQSVALHESIRELRELLGEAAADAEAREKRLAETLEAAALDAEARERRAADRDKRLYKVNVAMASLAGFTLLAAIVTLVVAIVQ